MNRIAGAIAEQIVAHVNIQVGSLQAATTEFRAVFNGPPRDILQAVFELLTRDGGIRTQLGSGEMVCIPVVYQVDRLPEGANNPPIGVSGICDHYHLLDLRNSPNCPRFIGLVPPGHQSNLSQTSTRSDFGLLAENNSGTSSIGNWWNDKFVEDLVAGAIDQQGNLVSGQRDEARKLVEEAVYAADEVDRHGASRRAAWFVLARLWEALSHKSSPFGKLVSLACGFPPSEDGLVDADAQIRVLKDLSNRLESEGFRPAIEHIKQRTDLAEEDERINLDVVLSHLQRNCDVPTALARAIPHYYAPFNTEVIDSPPRWWEFLTVEKWIKLLEEDDKRKGAIKIACVNPLPAHGIVVVASTVRLRITLPDEAVGATEVTLRREVSGANHRREWTLRVDGSLEFDDDDLPVHKAAARYSAEAKDLKKGTVKVISLKSWHPGFVVCSRTASKVVAPKPPRSKNERFNYETSLVLNGEGRHYLDVYTAPGFTLGREATQGDDVQTPDGNKTISISTVSDGEHGFEIDAANERYYELNIYRDETGACESARINLTCDEVTPEECGSEFERLIRLNRQREGGRATTDVHVNRQLRCSDLQSWMIAHGKIESSFYPLVIAPDYAQEWRTRDWTSQKDTIFSQGRFLNDPRPSPVEMAPPDTFLKCRRMLAERIRGKDEDGLVETARLGEWLATDTSFSELIEEYVRTYLEWLEAAPTVAAWCDLSIIAGFESDGTTLFQEPDAILVSPLHPVRLAWHCLAQRALFLAQKKSPCPAASIFDPDCVPDSLVLPLRTPTGSIKGRVFFSVECSSDYWAILWNGAKLDRLANIAGQAPFDQEFGVLVGGISSGFSVSQVHRALNDVSCMLVAKPVLNVLVSSAAGQNNACNEGLISWCLEHFAVQDQEPRALISAGARLVKILDERKVAARPDDAEISNLGEDTGNAVRWYLGSDGTSVPDLGIIAQLETASPNYEETKLGSPLAAGGLIRARIRQQLKSGGGAFLCESRSGLKIPATGDGLADKTGSALVRLENLGASRYGYSFAPNIHAIQGVLQKAEYAAVSSAAVDPACFLGGWLENTYLWDYDLPSYSSRSGDSNGYYLLSKIKEIDRETLKSVFSRLPNCNSLPEATIEQVLLEVARRGIPTVRGLSTGDAGASGDLGLFIAGRLLQDQFRISENVPSLLPIWSEVEGVTQIVLVVPVDPFQGYLDDLTKAVSKSSRQRPDLLVVAIQLSDSHIRCKLTPIEVKYRGAKEPMAVNARLDALEQAKSLSTLLDELNKRSTNSDLILWKIALQHLLVSIFNFAFRVYSQQPAVAPQASKWSEHHARVVSAVFSDELKPEIDMKGRLLVIDGTQQSAPKDHDNDGFSETIVLCHEDASLIAKGDSEVVYGSIKTRVKDWGLLPTFTMAADQPESSPTKVDAGKKIPIEITVPVLPTAGQLRSDEGAQPTSAEAMQRQLDDQNRAGEGLNPQSISLVNTVHAKNSESKGIELHIGTTVDGFREEIRTLNLSDTNLNQLNIGVVGDLGTGKTQLLKSLIYQISQSTASNQGITPRVLIFDYKKDYSSSDFVKAVGARVVKPWHLPLNLFDVAGAGESMTPWLDRFKFFSDVLDKIFANVGPVQRSNLKAAVKQAYVRCEGDGRQPNIYDVHAEYHTLVPKADSISAIIDDLVDSEIFSPTPGSAANFDDFFDGVVVVSLDALGQDDRTKNMLVAIMLNMFYEHMLRIPKRPFVGSEPKRRTIDSFLLVDEADNIMRYEFDVLRKLLLQGREFGVGVILASQYLRHFKAGATDYREPLLSWFVHKVPNVLPQELAALGLTGNVTPLTERVKTLSLHQCLFKTFDVQGDIIKGKPFYQLLENNDIPLPPSGGDR